MEASFLENIDNAAQKQVKEDDVTLGFTEKEYVGIVRVCVHCSYPTNLKAYISADLTGHCTLCQ